VQSDSRPVRRLLGVLFLAGLVILVDQSADLAATLLSRKIEVSAPAWRFGVFGLVAARTSTLLIGDVLLFASVVMLQWRTVIRALAAAHLLLAVAGLAALTLFLLDAIQVRGGMPPQGTAAFTAAVVRAALVTGAVVLTFAWAGVAAWRSGTGTPKGRRGSSPSLLVTDARDRPDS
jgi:hypothetical protein